MCMWYVYIFLTKQNKNYLFFYFDKFVPKKSKNPIFLQKKIKFIWKRFIKIDIDNQSRGSSVPSFQLTGKELMYTKRAVSLLSANCVSKRWSD